MSETVYVMGEDGAASALRDADKLQRAVRAFIKKADKIESQYENGVLDYDQSNARMWDAVDAFQRKVEGLV